jgi:Peptidase family M48
MNRGRWVLTASFLLALSAGAQQTPDAQSPAMQPATSAPSEQSAPPATPQSTDPQPTAVTAPSPTVTQPPASQATSINEVVDQIIEREHALINFLRARTPLIETYLQDVVPDPKFGIMPKQDHYFLGRLDLSDSIERRDYLHMKSSLLGGLTKPFRIHYEPLGFSWMIFADRQDFDRTHYDFRYVRREFLGEVRCLVFDVAPRPGSGRGRFEGRIWVEDQNYNIVRLNGTYAPAPRGGYFFHMDSWRLNLTPGFWLPAYIYSEEGDFTRGSDEKMSFRAQSRIWGYNLKKYRREEELTDVKVEAVKDTSATAQDASPLEAERLWQQQAEDNVLDRLQQAGLLAPPGDVDKVLQTVVNNIVVTNNIDLPRPVRARVMLTAPLETFSVFNTIVISRGLVDTLPDEASLAAILAHELGHIVLGHNIGSKFAFSDRMLFSDDSTYQRFGFRHTPEEEAAADAKAMDLLKNSPYGQKLASSGLYLKQLQVRAPKLHALLRPHLGNSFVDDKQRLIRLTALMNSAPELDDNKLDQIAALPLGGRIKLDPWEDRVEMLKATPVSIVSIRDKNPFGVSPFFPRLTRYGTIATPANAAAAQNTGASPQQQ